MLKIICRWWNGCVTIYLNLTKDCASICTWFINFQTLICNQLWCLVATSNKKEEYPFIKKKPGPLSFQIGGLRFRQLVYDRERNKKPFKYTPGPLSFRLGPIRFNQIPQKHLPYDPCCIDPTASCYLLAVCDLDV